MYLMDSVLLVDSFCCLVFFFLPANHMSCTVSLTNSAWLSFVFSPVCRDSRCLFLSVWTILERCLLPLLLTCSQNRGMVVSRDQRYDLNRNETKWKKEEGRRKKEEGRRKKEEGRRNRQRTKNRLNLLCVFVLLLAWFCDIRFSRPSLSVSLSVSFSFSLFSFSQSNQLVHCSDPNRRALLFASCQSSLL